MSGFSYDPANIGEYGKDRMRFELGDVIESETPDGLPCYVLEDAEIEAILGAYPKRWKLAKFYLVESVMRRFSYEVDTRVAPAEWKYHQRWEAWKAMYDELKKEVDALGMPVNGIMPGQRRPPYFYEGMMNNPPLDNPGVR